MTETERTETDDEYLTLTLNPLGRRNGALSGPCLAACVLSVLCFVMFGLVRTQFSRSSLETLANNLSKILSIQISSWWGGAAAQETKPYDPTDPKQNPLNPQGVKPYVIHILPVVVHNFNSFIPFFLLLICHTMIGAAPAHRLNLPGMIVSSNLTRRKRTKNARNLSSSISRACEDTASMFSAHKRAM